MKQELEVKIQQIKDDGKVDGVDILQEIWDSNITSKEKITLSLKLADRLTTYSVLCNMWLNYSMTHSDYAESTQEILAWYKAKLSEDRDYSDSVEYSLYFDILEQPKLNEYAWEYFLSSESSKNFIRLLLKNSGPVPYEAKNRLFQKIVKIEEFHVAIYESIGHSCFDNCGQVDREKAKETYQRLNLDVIPEDVKHPVRYKSIEEVEKYLNLR